MFQTKNVTCLMSKETDIEFSDAGTSLPGPIPVAPPSPKSTLNIATTPAYFDGSTSGNASIAPVTLSDLLDFGGDRPPGYVLI
jgi:hypothetical protein